MMTFFFLNDASYELNLNFGVDFEMTPPSLFVKAAVDSGDKDPRSDLKC